ncbi:DUF2059 domain-containing protein [Chryseobacterium sp. Leaf394]|uniref:DUF2059 domain-containing protein n=1 Tax=Chryseobacterium sp. Leaf394 TaxID=1736361 RepID=UPI0006F78599|nr:DUF2059 domain-containing protein [Chryseobacterium sp. Leaf394]KQS89144.1 hypothetical protein ASG21_15240 [Chryseobacterium sp. Leaf394]
MKKITICCALILGIFAFGQNSKELKVRELMTLTGAGNIGVDSSKRIADAFKEVYPNISEEFWNEFSKEIKASDLEDLIVPIYLKYYSEEDLNNLISFYRTPIGKKIIASTPLIMKESSEAGMKWGKEIGQKILKKLEAEDSSVRVELPPSPMKMPSK